MDGSRTRWTREEGAEFGSRLRRLREAAGLRQRDLAFPGCTAAYISRIEHGERYPSVVLIRQLAARIGVAAEELEFGDPAEVGVCARADVGRINEAAARFGVGLRWQDLDAGERERVVVGLDDALVDALAARVYAVALGRETAEAGT